MDGLNPCFSGKLLREDVMAEEEQEKFDVLILVLVESW